MDQHVKQLVELPRKHGYFIGFDSDGCVFDSMEIKQKECFCPAFIKHFGLQAASKYARETWEFVNLYSKDRGCNRFLAVEKTFKLMRQRRQFAQRGVKLVDTSELSAWLKVETKLGNPALKKLVAEAPTAEMKRLLAWSLEVNTRIEDMVFGIPPFPGVREVLAAATGKADMIVVSQTPLEALEREWEEAGIRGSVSMIAGQEHGTKTEHLGHAAKGHYAPGKILMVGDAPGDRKAAEGNQALFFPVVPGREEQSWAELAGEGLKRFFNGTFAGEYQNRLVAEFDAALPADPHWNN
jgi:phosphoglycolate phosphatase-like HAD superfamily hydrolase